MLESLFNKVAGLQHSYDCCEIFENSFFQKTPPMAGSEKIINLQGKNQWRRRNRSTFSINTAE